VGDRRDNGSGDRRSPPWLDPAAGVQALVDVQRRGLLAASDLVDRLVGSVDGDSAGVGDVPAAASPGAGGDAQPAAGATEDLVRLWVDMVRLGLDAFGGLLTPEATGPSRGPGGATVDVATARSTDVVRLTVGRGAAADGEADVEAGVEVWLHNGSGQAYTGLLPHCGDLRTSDGGVLPAAAVGFDPPVVDLPARSSRGVVVTVTSSANGSGDVSAGGRVGAPPGTYRGVILVGGLPEVWLPVEVAVVGHPAEA
jgi:hypothetical protein